jgi:hypothetical protein
VPGPDPRIRHRTQIGMFRSIRLDHTNCLQVAIKTHIYKSVLTNALIKNRHCGITFCILVQNLRSVPKGIRLNCNVIQLCKFQNQNIILNDLYEEVSNAVSQEDFYNLYMYCLATPYGSLIIDMSDKEMKFSCNFGTRLTIGDIEKVGKTDKTDKTDKVDKTDEKKS